MKLLQMARSTCLQPGDLRPPRVFVSSTFQDVLVEIRDKLRVELEEMNVQPVMWELPSFPYTHGQAAVERDAIAAVASTQLYVLVIGRRYGTVEPHERLAITELEYRAARAQALPVLVYVQQHVWDGYRAYAGGAIGDGDYTHWVDEKQVFEFIDRIAQHDRQRCVCFTRSQEIITDLKAQMANLVGGHLRFERRAAEWLWTEWQTADVERAASIVWILTPNFFWDYADREYRQLVLDNMSQRGTRYCYLYRGTPDNTRRVDDMARDIEAATSAPCGTLARYAPIPPEDFNWCTEQALFDPGHPENERGAFVDIMDGHGKSRKHNIELGREKRRDFREQFSRLWARHGQGDPWLHAVNSTDPPESRGRDSNPDR